MIIIKENKHILRRWRHRGVMLDQQTSTYIVPTTRRCGRHINTPWPLWIHHNGEDIKVKTNVFTIESFIDFSPNPRKCDDFTHNIIFMQLAVRSYLPMLNMLWNQRVLNWLVQPYIMIIDMWEAGYCKNRGVGRHVRTVWILCSKTMSQQKLNMKEQQCLTRVAVNIAQLLPWKQLSSKQENKNFFFSTHKKGRSCWKTHKGGFCLPDQTGVHSMSHQVWIK